MSGSSGIHKHPLVRDGNSQSERKPDALATNYVQLDERKLEDILEFVYQYAKQINYYDKELIKSDWVDFFAGSIPFQLAFISKFDLQSVRDHYDQLTNGFNEGLDQLNLTPLFNYLIDLSHTVNHWFVHTKLDQSGFHTQLFNIIDNDLRFNLYRLIACANAANNRHLGYEPEFRLESLREENVWGLDIMRFVAVDETLMQFRGTRHTLIKETAKKLEELFQVYFNGMKQIVQIAPAHLEKSLTILDDEEQDYPAHLGLFFAFLKVFEEVRNDLNLNTKKHLEFFYKEVLKLKENPAVPDQAHLIFELAKHLENHKIEAGTPFTAGDDDAGSEMIFQLEEEIVVQKAQIESLRTLFLDQEATTFDHPVDKNPDGTPKTLQAIHSVYAAPIANSADGKGADFGDIDPPSWATLGSVDSKIAEPDTFPIEFEPQPLARLGLLLAAQVLYLKEGTRTIQVDLNCTLPPGLEPGSEDFVAFQAAVETKFEFTDDTEKFLLDEGVDSTRVDILRNAYGAISKSRTEFENYLLSENVSNFEEPLILKSIKRTSPLKVYLSGEGEWLEPHDVDMSFIDPGNDGNWRLRLFIRLDNTFDPILFYDPEAFEVDFGTTLPIARIELDQNIQFELKTADLTAEEIADGFTAPTTAVTTYHIFRDLKINAAQIEVDVQGVREFIVQNDTGLLDAGSSFAPFGTVPKTGSTFYIGSQEVFHKKLTNLDIQISWEDLPPSFLEHYRMYGQKLMRKDLKARFSILNFQQWLPLGADRKQLFASIPYAKTSNVAPFNYTIQIGDAIENITGTGSYNSFNTDQELEEAISTVVHLASNADNYVINNNSGNHSFTIGFDNAGTHVPMATSTKTDYTSAEVNEAIEKTVELFASFSKIALSADSTDFDLFKASAVQEQEQFSFLSQNGFVRLELGPKNFLHSRYVPAITLQANAVAAAAFEDDPRFVAGASYRNRTDFTDVRIDSTGAAIPAGNTLFPELPNEPYTPTISELVIDYKAEAKSAQIDLIHLYPYEHANHLPIKVEDSPRLLPKFVDQDEEEGVRAEKEGSLLIGINELIPGNNLDILFQVAESTADPDLEQADVTWHYLKDNTWVPLRKDLDVLEDATNGLISSGVIKFAIPRDINQNNTILPNNLHWIKATVELRSAAVSQCINCHTQAAKVSFLPGAENDLNRLENPLDAESIADFTVNNPAIAAVAQTYQSFAGEPEEETDTFYIRVSEHLRHKGRAITLFDYERLVLEAFPEIHRVKCITHTLGRRQEAFDYELAPGFVTLAVIPDLSQLKYADRFQPKVTLGTLKKIEAYLMERTSPFVRLQVLNPRYEEIRVKGKVQFKEGKSKEFYRKEIEKDIQRFLSPWAFASDSEKINFGGKVFKSSIVNFIEKLDYVDYAEDFIMLDENDEAVNEIAASSSRSILVSGKHEINPSEPGDCTTENEKDASMTGIGYLKIGDKC